MPSQAVSEWLEDFGLKVFDKKLSDIPTRGVKRSERTSTGGFECGTELREFKGVKLELWYDGWISGGGKNLFLGACFSLPDKIFELFYRRHRNRYPLPLGNRNISKYGAISRVSNDILTKMNLQNPFFESYPNAGNWFTKYYANYPNPHKNSSATRTLVNKVAGLFREILESPDFFGDLEPEKGTQGVESKVEDESPKAQRRIPAKAKQGAFARADYKCECCDFPVHVEGRHILDAHHKNPMENLKVGNSRSVKPSDLIALCPNCHPIAHTKNLPLDIKAIQTVRNRFYLT